MGAFQIFTICALPHRGYMFVEACGLILSYCPVGATQISVQGSPYRAM